MFKNVFTTPRSNRAKLGRIPNATANTSRLASCESQTTTDDSDKVAMEELLRKKEELERKKEDLERRFKEIETKVEDLEKKNS